MEITACVPVYNNENTVAQTVISIIMQDFVDEIILGDDASTDNSQIACLNVISLFGEAREIKYYRNQVNLGCGRNLQKLTDMARGDLILYMCADDVIADPYYMKKVKAMIESRPETGIINRGYYWFTDKYDIPVRYKKMGKTSAETFDCFDQISGIVVKKSTMIDNNIKFSNKPWVEMVSVAAQILKKGYEVFQLPEYAVAVRIANNGSMRKESFRESPTRLWYNEVKDMKYFDKYPASKHEGLIQVKRFGGWDAWVREIKEMVAIDRKNLITPRFWFYVLLTSLPASVLKVIIETYRKIPKRKQ